MYRRLDIRNIFRSLYPNVDLSELNIDWLITAYDQLFDVVDDLEKRYSELEILTADQIQALIDSAIRTNNQFIGAMLEEMRITITDDYTNAILNMRTEIYAKMLADITTAVANCHAYTDAAERRANSYTDSKIIETQYMYDPITGIYSPIPEVIDNVIYYFHGQNQMTAGEFDAANLTVTAYEALDLSAIDFDFRAKEYIN